MRKILLSALIFCCTFSFFAWAQDNNIGYDIVNTPQKLQLLYRKALKVLAERLGITVKRPVLVKLVAAEELDKICPNSPYNGNTVGLCTKSKAASIIYIMAGRAEDEVFSTLLHEYTHAWQEENCPKQSPVLREGFARWVEYKGLKAIGFDLLAESYVGDRDPWYGLGLCKMFELEDKIGEKACLEYAKTHKDFDF